MINTLRLVLQNEANFNGDGRFHSDQMHGHLAHDAEEWELERLIAFDNETDGRTTDAAGPGT